MDIQQNTLYLTTPGAYVARDHLTLQIEVPVYPPDLPPEKRHRESATSTRKLSVPIHHLESVCIFGASTISPPAMDLCWEHGVAVNFLSENGYFQARVTGVADTSVTLRRAQFRAADDPVRAAAIGRQIVAGKIQNSRNSLLRTGRETDDAGEQAQLAKAGDALAQQVFDLGKTHPPLDQVRGIEGMAAQTYFSVFGLLLKQQRDEFSFTTRSRRPPRDRINCLLSFLYALVRHDCIAALTSIGLYAAGIQPVAIGIDPSTNHFVFTANYLGGNVSDFQMSATAGTLINTQGSPYAGSAQLTAVAAVPHGGSH